MSKPKINTMLTSVLWAVVFSAGSVTTGNAAVSELLIAEKPNNAYILAPANQLGQYRYIIQFKEPALAAYKGQGALMAPMRLANGKIDVKGQAAQAYVNRLKDQQLDFVNEMSQVLGRNVTPVLSFQYSYNGMAVYLAADEVAIVGAISSVKSLQKDRDYYMDTDAGPQLIGANNIWLGNAPASGVAFGEGVVIGTLDTGTNFDHPSFADVGGDAYDHTNPLGSGNYLGVCDDSNVEQYDPTYTCNDKLIGGYDFVNGLEPQGATEIPGPEDENGHGSHTSSTSGGNVVTGDFSGIVGINMSGVAPHATNIIFDVCYETEQGQGLCPGASSVASVDQAIADGLVDVINFSIAGGSSPWTDSVSQAFLNATDAGIFIAAAAGNGGPGPATLGHVEPWTTASGAMTHNRRFSNNMDVTGTDPVPAILIDVFALQGTGPAMMANMTGTYEYSGTIDAANVEGCNPFPADSFNGLVALISRGSCNFSVKVDNAAAAGAIGVVVHNNIVGEPFIMSALEATTIPSVMVAQNIGAEMVSFKAGDMTAGADVDFNVGINLSGQADIMSSFSSRGPSPYEYNKPDVSAPGQSILAAYDDETVAPDMIDEYNAISGTSMASPHTAGAAALLRELHPSWTPMEIKSALMMTAKKEGNTKEDGVTSTDHWDDGAGRIQVDVASSTGLVMNETGLKFFQADPDNGGDPKTLNAPNLTNYECIETCSFQRKLRSVASEPVTYDASLSGIPGTVNPSQFTVNPGQTVTLDIEVNGALLPAGDFSFGELSIIESTAEPFTINPNLSIPGGFDGSLGSMACEDFVVAGFSSPIYSVSVETAIDHTWGSDLEVKLVNPNGDILTVMNANSGGGTDLVSTHPVIFVDGAAVSAENMGTGLGDSEAVCRDDDICEYAPAPDNEPSPPDTFEDLVNLEPGDGNGTWQLCLGDNFIFADDGTLVSATLNMIGESNYPDLHMPAVIVGFPDTPEIDVNPTSLAATLDADMNTDLVLNIANLPLAGADLNWSLNTNDLVSNAIFQQLQNGTGGIVSDFFNGANAGVYSADQFVLSGDSSIDTVSFKGFLNNGATDITQELTSVTVSIYADDAGVPAGHPEDGNGSELLTVTVGINDAGIDTGTGEGDFTIDLNVAAGGSWEMPAGTYWITAWGDLTGANQWFWFQGEDQTGANAHIIDPQDFFQEGFTDWTDLTSLNPVLAGLAFSLDQQLTCGAPWMSVLPNAGVLSPGSDEDVTVTLDSTGLTPGVYSAAVCIDSDDLDEPQVVIPVTLTVDDLIFEDNFDGP